MNILLVCLILLWLGPHKDSFNNDFEGTWKCTAFHLTLKFDKGKDQEVHMPNGFASTLIFKSNGQNKGTVISKALGSEDQGIWKFHPSTARLEIQYKTTDQMLYVYRKVSWKGKTMVLTADDALVLQQYKDNHLEDQGIRRLVGGQIQEEYTH